MQCAVLCLAEIVSVQEAVFSKPNMNHVCVCILAMHCVLISEIALHDWPYPVSSTGNGQRKAK